MYNKQRVRLVTVFCAILLLLGVLAYIYRERPNIDVAEEGSATDYSYQARIVDGKDLLSALGSVKVRESFAEDLFAFAKTNYVEYKDFPDKVVGFRVTSDISKLSKNVISFEGQFGSIKNKIRVEITILNNEQIRTSITDTKSQQNIDNELPSNDDLNQFIGSLPYSGSSYEIEYVQASNLFLITLYDSSARTEAEKALADGLGVPDLKGKNYRVVIPSSGGEGEGSPPG